MATDTPPGPALAVKCSGCGEILFNKDFEKSFKVCPKCGHHHRLTAEERITITVDEDSFEPLAETVSLTSRDFLSFPDYPEKLAVARGKAGLEDSFRVGVAKIESQPLVLGVSEFGFMGGSMGSVAGEKIAIAIENAIELGLPVVFFTTSGGARMQEGLMALMQMAKTSAACSRLAVAGLPLIVVLTDPTTGGVMASYASLGDVILAEPGALLVLAGQRVAAQAAQGQKLPANYQSSEWRLEQGHIDQIVARRDLRSTLSRLIGLLSPERAAGARPRQKRTANARNGHANGAGRSETPAPAHNESELPK
jgi:acetyl-CoA carboxylase carboxyl transferase subunit beta